jgi:geranylgeranyl diphosphate synthase, type II
VDLQTFLDKKRALVQKSLQDILTSFHVSGALREAMEYSLLAAGKRLRPILAIAVCEAVKGPVEAVMPYGCAIEMIHTYSLIHDDLPCMDDDDLRRGRPTSHMVFGEATAVLAGDALLTEAFRVMAAAGNATGAQASVACRIIFEVAQAAGVEGMVGGQVLDVLYEGQEGSKEILDTIHRQKTAALIRAAVLAGALVAGVDDTTLARFTTYGDSIGLAFQIKDDLLDVDGDESQVGKRLKKDDRKQTYVKHYGIEASKKKIDELINQAIESIDCLGPGGKILVELARRMGDRAF